MDLEGDALRDALGQLLKDRGKLADSILQNEHAAAILDQLMTTAAAEGVLDAVEAAGENK
jgi:hypothetical protein